MNSCPIKKAVNISSLTAIPTTILFLSLEGRFTLGLLLFVPLIIVPITIFVTAIIGLPIHCLLQRYNFKSKIFYWIAGCLAGLIFSYLNPFGMKDSNALLMFGILGANVAITFHEVLERLKCNQ